MATDPLEQEAIDRQASSAFWDTVSWAGGTALLFLTAVVLVVVSPGPSPYENIPATAIALFLAWKSWRKTQVANEKRKRLPPPRFLRPPVFIPPGEAQGDSTWELSDEIRPRHVWITGKSGYGKSNLMLLMALRDIGRGKGVTVIDPGADLVRFIMERLPPERLADVIYLGLDNPIPLDFMNCDDDAERELLVGDLMKTFRRLSEMAGGQWGVRMDAILRDVLYTLLNAQNVAFTDIYYFLVDKKRRSEILRQPTIPNDLRQRWETRFPHDEAIEPLISRMTPIIRTKSLSAIFGSPHAKLNIYDAMQQQKVILVDLGGTSESSIMYGSMLVSKFQQAAFRRAKLAPEARVPHYLYVDEFANFQTSEFETILSQGRKFQLCLTVANQWVSQLSTEIRSAVLGGASTWFLFRLSPEDISFFKTHAPPVRHYDTNDYCTVNEKGEVVYDYWEDRRLRPPFDLAQLGRLDRGIALHCRAEGIANVTHLPGPPAIHQGMNYAEIIKKRTIEKYGCAPRQGPIHSAHDNKGTGQRDQGKHQDARKPRDSADEASASSGGADKPDSEFFE